MPHVWTTGSKMTFVARGSALKPSTSRTATAAAIPADAPAFICTTQAGVVTCTDEAGAPVQGEQLKQLQALLKPIADAPALSDKPVGAQGQTGVASDTKMVSDASSPASITPVPAQDVTLPEDTKKAVPVMSSAAPAKSGGDLAAPVPEQVVKSDMSSRTVPKKTSPPTTLATPDLSPNSPGSDARAYAVSSRGNDESVNFSAPATPPPAPSPPAPRPASALIPGNFSNASAASSPSSKAQPSDGFPGNVDPGMQPAAPAVASASGKAQKIEIVNERGLIPGNLQMEETEIVTMLQAVNEEPIKYFKYKIYPGNVPPDAPQVASAAVGNNVPGNVTPVGDMKAVKMEVYPGNIPPDFSDVLDLSKGNES